MSHLIALASWTVFCIGFGIIGTGELEHHEGSLVWRTVFAVVALIWSLGIIVYMVMPLVVEWIWS